MLSRSRSRAPIVLGQSCHALRALLLCEFLWHQKLVSEFGFTDAGLALWRNSQREKNRRFAVAYFYFAVKHEALEFSLLREPVVNPPHRVVDGEYVRDIDLKLTVELANPWPVDVWTFFAVATGGESSWTAAVESGSLALWDGATERIHVAGFAAPHERDVVLVSLATEAMRERHVPHRFGYHPTQTCELAGFGWMGGQTDAQQQGSVPAVQGMLLPAHATGTGLVVLGEHKLRLSPAAHARSAWDAIAAAGEVALDVVQCVDVRAYGLEDPLHDASSVDLRCSAGAEVLTTARPGMPHNRRLAGRDFEFGPSPHREHIGSRERHDTTRHVGLYETREPHNASLAEHACNLNGETLVIQGGSVVAGEVVAAPSGADLLPLTMTMLSRSRAVAPLRGVAGAGACDVVAVG